jgi:molybdopterin molybdotransferase
MLEIPEAYAQLSDLADRIRASRYADRHEAIATVQAHGRVLAKPVHCRYDAPAFDQSAMDGIAFAWQADLSRLKVLGRVAAGDAPNGFRLEPGECVRIMTGAPVPETTDTVVPVEQLAFSPDGKSVAVQATPEKAEHVRKQGENLRAGDVLLTAGHWINAASIAAMTSQGLSEVSVFPQIRVGILTTGDEVVDHQAELAPGQIHDSNGPGLSALLNRPHLAFQQLGSMPDDLEGLQRLLESHTSLDIVILTGGVSMGDFDFVPKAAEQAGFKPLFHKVRIKPGKPLLVSEHESGCVLFGLPGNPVSTLVSTQLFVLPFLTSLLGETMQPPLEVFLPLSGAAKGAKFPYYVPVTWSTWEGELAVAPVPISGSGDIVRFAGGETLACLPPQRMIEPGEKVQVLLLHSHRVG